MLLTKREIAKRLQMPPSTLSGYFLTYGEWIPAISDGKAKHPMYEEVAVEILKLISTRIKEGRNSTEIRLELEKKHPKIIDGNDLAETPGNSTTTLARLSNNQNLATLLEQLNRLKDHSRTLTETNASFKATVEQSNFFLEEKDKTIEEYKSRLIKKEAELRDCRLVLEEKETELAKAKQKIAKLEKGTLFYRLSKALG